MRMRLADRTAQVGRAALGAVDAAAGTTAGRGQPDRLDDPAQRRELLGRTGRERLRSQHLGVGGDQAEPGLLLVAAVAARLGLRDLQHRLASALDLSAERFGRRRLLLALGEEEPPEHPVVDRDLVVPGHQRGPAGPVQVEQVGRVERGHRRAVGEHVARPTDSPAPRSSRAKPTSRRTKAASSGTEGDPFEVCRGRGRGRRVPSRPRRACPRRWRSSAAYVSGLAALILERNPALKPAKCAQS